MSRKAIPVGFLVLASILLVLGLSLNAIIDRNRGRIQEEIQKALGRPLTFGELSLSFWGGIGLSAKELRIADDPRFAATPFVQTKELRMQLGWLPLLVGRIQIKKFILDEPEIQIIKNEEGIFNLATLVTRERKPRGPGERKDREKRPGAPELLLSNLNVKNGRVDFIDRSSKEPVEIRVRNVDLDVRGLALDGAAKVKIAVSLFEAQGQNIRLEGQVGPSQGERAWSQVPVDLQLRVDSLLLPQLTRAIPAVRERLSRYLEATGPVALQARLLGTLERPRIADLNFSGPFFGATSNNTAVKGDLDFSKGSSWEEGEIKAKVVVNPVDLDDLRRLPFFKQTLPSRLTSEGPISVAGDIQGTLRELKIQATITGGESEIQYGNWLKKAKGVPAEISLRMERRKERLILEQSLITLNNLKLKFSGSLDELPERRLMLRLSSDGLDLAGWDKLVMPLSGYNTRGNLRWDLSISKNLSQQDSLEIRGDLSLADVQAKDKKSGRGVDRATARISFRGKEARVEQLALRAGSSDISLDGTLTDPSRPTLRYSLRSQRLNLSDLTGLAAHKSNEMKSLTSVGELQIRDGKTSVRGNVSSSEGTLEEIPYRNLRGEVAWSPTGLSFKNLSFQAMNGTLRGAGSWETGARNSVRLVLDPNIESMDLKPLLSRQFPRFKDHIEGQLNLKAKLNGESKASSELPQSIQGEGEAHVRGGSLRDFNLAQLVISKVSGMPGGANLISSRIPARVQALLEKKDTSFDTLGGTFTVKQGRIYSDDLLLATPDYSITAKGSMGLDKSMKWDATLVMSPQFTQELIQESKNARYMLDQKGRLAIPFRLEGTLPRVQAKPDLRALIESIQRGLLRKRTQPTDGEGEKEPKKRERRDRIPKELEQLFEK